MRKNGRTRRGDGREGGREEGREGRKDGGEGGREGKVWLLVKEGQGNSYPYKYHGYLHDGGRE